jgi:ADP-heptose:LPS heptosyltransferase
MEQASRHASLNPIVLIRFSSIGDILLCEPLPRLLKRREPNRPIYFVTKSGFREIPEGWPDVDRVFCLGSTKGALDTIAKELTQITPSQIYDLHNTLRSRRLMSLASFGKKTRLKTLPKHRLHKLALVYGKPFLKYVQEPPPVAERLLSLANLHGEDPAHAHPRLVVNGEALYQGEAAFHLLVPGAGRWTKTWPKEHWKKLTLGLIAESDLPIVIAGGKDDVPLAEALVTLNPNRVSSYAGKLSLSESAKLVARSKNIVVGDTGLMHMADAAHIPGVVLFGGTVPALGFPPLNGTLRILERNLACRPCHHFGRQECPKKHFQCMEELTPELVLKALLTEATQSSPSRNLPIS